LVRYTNRELKGAGYELSTSGRGTRIAKVRLPPPKQSHTVLRRGMFESYLSRWKLAPDGAPIATPAAHLLPVLKDGKPAMLKISHEADERLGGVLMEWWGGDGAAQVFARDGDALLMERATGPASRVRWPGPGGTTRHAVSSAQPPPDCMRLAPSPCRN